MAPNYRSLGFTELPWRLRQTDFPAHQPRTLGGERDLQFRLARQGTQTTSDRALERFGR
jgi:hypothetical protein